jgi:septal ring factor EnvC (AmiA/AmiB activator)
MLEMILTAVTAVATVAGIVAAFYWKVTTRIKAEAEAQASAETEDRAAFRSSLMADRESLRKSLAKCETERRALAEQLLSLTAHVKRLEARVEQLEAENRKLVRRAPKAVK